VSYLQNLDGIFQLDLGVNSKLEVGIVVSAPIFDLFIAE